MSADQMGAGIHSWRPFEWRPCWHAANVVICIVCVMRDACKCNGVVGCRCMVQRSQLLVRQRYLPPGARCCVRADGFLTGQSSYEYQPCKTDASFSGLQATLA